MKICMIVPDKYVKGGIASVVNGYRKYNFGCRYEVKYVESYCDGSKLRKLLKAIESYFVFGIEIARNRPDLVHIHSSFGPSFYRKIPFIMMASWRKIPVINHIHGAEFDAFYRNASSAKQRRVKHIYGKCNILIALSEEWKANLALIVPKEKVVVIENYCEIPEIKLAEKKNQILFMGEIGQRKGCFDIPEIYWKTRERVGNAELVMAGDGAVSQVKALLAEKRLDKEVSFPGWVRGEERKTLLRESGIFLFPSYHEGMPMAVLEAMAYGMAIVTTSVGGIPRLIEDGISGYLCQPGDTGQISVRLAELLKDEGKRRRLGEAARKKAIESYSMERHMDRLLTLYNSFCK